PASPPEPTPAEPARPGPNEFTGSAAVKPIYFDFNKYAIRPGDARILEANAEWLKKSAAMLVLIEGHCDERGTIEYNLALGERRARAARDYLISNGIAAERISIVSFGAERPAEFAASGADAGTLVATFQQLSRETTAALATLAPSELDRRVLPPQELWGTGQPHEISRRDALVESVRHAALHLGELRLTRD